jgi:hypothetical protein
VFPSSLGSIVTSIPLRSTGTGIFADLNELSLERLGLVSLGLEGPYLDKLGLEGLDLGGLDLEGVYFDFEGV